MMKTDTPPPNERMFAAANVGLHRDGFARSSSSWKPPVSYPSPKGRGSRKRLPKMSENITRHYAAVLAVMMIIVFLVSALPDYEPFAAITGRDVPPPPPVPSLPECGGEPEPPRCDFGEPEPQVNSEGCIQSYACPERTCTIIEQNTILSSNRDGECFEVRSGVVFDGAGYRITGSGDVAIKADNATGFTIRNFRISGYKTGISIASSSSFLITGNNITASGTGSVVNPLAGISLRNSRSASVSGNHIETSGTRVYGIFAPESSASIRNNTIATRSSDSHGISLVNGDYAVERNYIATEERGSSGIKLASSGSPSVRQNEILTLSPNSPSLVVDQSPSAAIRRNNVSTSGSSSHAVRISSSPTFAAEENIIRARGSFSDGFSVVNSAAGAFRNNHVTASGFQSSGIRLSGSPASISGGRISASGSALEFADSDSSLSAVEAQSQGNAVNAVSSAITASYFVAGNSVIDFEGAEFALKDSAAPQAPSGHAIIDAVDITAGAGARLLLAIYYSESALAGLVEGSAAIWKHSSGQWAQEGFYSNSGLDAGANKVFADITDFSSIFAAVAQQRPESVQCPEPPGQPACSGSLLPLYNADGCIEDYECVSCSAGSRRGDVNSDGSVTSRDSSFAMQIVSGSLPAPQDICCIDVNPYQGNGIIDMDDAEIIGRIASGSLSSAGTCSNPLDPENPAGIETISCTPDSMRGDADGNGEIAENDIRLVEMLANGDAVAGNICCIDLYPLPAGDGIVNEGDSYVIASLLSGSLGTGNAGTCSSIRDPRVSDDCPLPTPPTACEQAPDGSWKRSHIEYSGDDCAPAVIEEACCPPSCGEDGEWSSCQNGARMRASYACSAETGFTCVEQAQTEACASPEESLQLIEQLGKSIGEASGTCNSTLPAEQKLAGAEQAFQQGDYNAAAGMAREGLLLVPVCAEPAATDYTIVLAALIAIIAASLLAVFFMHRKRIGIMRKEESPQNVCAVCNDFTISRARCAVCKKPVCLRHMVKKGGRIYCTRHA